MILRCTVCVAALAGLLTASASMAAETWHTSTLKIVYPLANGEFVLGFDSDPSTCSSTSSPKYLHVYVGQNGITADGSAKLFAAAMAALVSRQSVSAVFDDALAYCYVNRLTVQN